MISKAKIKKLVQASFKNNQIDPNRTARIAKLLKGRELKDYIKFLKRFEEGNTVTLIVPDDKISNVPLIVEKIKKAYPGKRLQIKTDPNLIGGMKVINDDLIYDFSIKDILEEAVEKI